MLPGGAEDMEHVLSGYNPVKSHSGDTTPCKVTPGYNPMQDGRNDFTQSPPLPWLQGAAAHHLPAATRRNAPRRMRRWLRVGGSA